MFSQIIARKLDYFKKLGVYWTFRQLKKKGFLSIWVLICIILAKCDIYAQFIAFKCIVQWIQGFQKRKLGLKNSRNKYDTAAGLEGFTLVQCYI